MNLLEFSDTYTSGEIYNTFHNKLLHVINKHTPIKVLTNKEVKSTNKPSISSKNS